MGAQSRSKRRSNAETSLLLRCKELVAGSAPSSSKKRSGDEIEVQRPPKKFHLIEAAESKKSIASPSAVQPKDDVAHATMTGIQVLPQTAPVELPLRPLHATSSLPASALAIADHSSEWEEQDVADEEDFAFNFAMGVPVFNGRATDIAKLLGAYDPLEDEYDEEERLGEPLEAFHSSFYELAGLRANGEEVSDVGSDDEESGDSSGDELESDEDEDEDDEDEFGDDEVDSASFIGDDEEKEEWEEHDYSDADLDAEEDVSDSDDERDDDETEFEGEGEGEGERKGRVLRN